MLSDSSAAPYIPDIPMHPSAIGKTDGPAEPRRRLLDTLVDLPRNRLDRLSRIAASAEFDREERHALEHMQLGMLVVVPARHVAEPGQAVLALLRAHRFVHAGVRGV